MMAALAELASLTDELVTAITSVYHPDRNTINLYRESALRNLRYPSYPRTNQFEVEDRLDGLEERFRIQDREGLADALRERLVALEVHSTKWTPEILHLLLELSDQPTQKSRLGDLYTLTRFDASAGPRLTWDEIAEEDGWRDDGALWRTIDYADSSSDDGGFADTRSESSRGSLDSSLSSADVQQTAQDLLVGARSPVALRRVERSQAWRYATLSRDSGGRQHKTAISDYQLLRELLFMLSGLPTTLFDLGCDPVANYQLANVSWDSFRALLTSFSECGRSLQPLRAFAEEQQDVPLMQVFRDAVQKSLLSLDGKISDMQARYIVFDQDVVVSLMKIQPELKPYLSPLFVLSGIVGQLKEEQYAHPFRYLELLFDAAGAAQSEGKESVYRALATMFFDCFSVYLRPIRLWMEDGALIPGDRIFFVSQIAVKAPLSQIWQSQFKLRQTQDGLLHAPRFLQPAAKRIFTTGKSVNVLKHLGHYESAKARWAGAEPGLDFASINAGDVGFAPFPELFNHAFDLWIKSKHHKASATLREVLYETCQLSKALDSLQHLYLCSDATVADAFAVPLFRRLDALNPTWKDRFTLTEIAQDAFSNCADTYRLSVDVDHRAIVHSGAVPRNTVRAGLPAIRLTYRLHWPLQTVMPPSSIAGYQAVFTFLLQLRRGTYMLRKQWVARSSTLADSAPETHRFYWLIRTKLLWFCKTLATYLTSIVLAPSIAAMREALRNATDLDDMISIHSAFIHRITEEACLGAKLNPLRGCILEVVDLAIKLQDAHKAEVARETEEFQEASRLSVMSSPHKSPSRQIRRAKRGPYARPGDDDDDHDDHDDDNDDERVYAEPDDGGLDDGSSAATHRPYLDTLGSINADYEKHMRFISGGLRGVARAIRDPVAGKWDILAEMLDMGHR